MLIWDKKVYGASWSVKFKTWAKSEPKDGWIRFEFHSTYTYMVSIIMYLIITLLNNLSYSLIMYLYGFEQHVTYLIIN